MMQQKKAEYLVWQPALPGGNGPSTTTRAPVASFNAVTVSAT